MPADLILHHYPNSPFSEKVRVAFGIKQLAWKSVVIPNIMPKPDLMPLTGGYRKTPVLQIGADIYCDTQLIMLEIERRHAKPPLLPVGQEGEARALAMWIDRNIFWSAVGVVMGAIGDQLPEAFKKDRTEFSGRPFDGDRLKAAAPFAREQTYAQLSIAEQMLRDGRPFLLGGVPSLADCALYNPVWFLQARMGVGDTPSPLDRLPKIVEWSRRMKAFGGGKPTEMSADDALAVARAATPEPGKVDDGDPSGLKAGQSISITPDDTGKVPVTGTLVGLTNQRISIIRSDERVGDVIVHFPRAGFVVTPA
jgi:glutathione S-transferase